LYNRLNTKKKGGEYKTNMSQLPHYIEYECTLDMQKTYRFIKNHKNGVSARLIADNIGRDYEYTKDHSHVTRILSKLTKRLLEVKASEILVNDIHHHVYLICEIGDQRLDRILPTKIEAIRKQVASLNETKRGYQNLI
jgi:hypothetical protein